MSDIVTYAIQGHLGLITLNNPPVNALSVSKGVLQRILDAIKEGEHDPNVRAFLVHGSGRAFSGGADVTEFGTPKAAREPNHQVERWSGSGPVLSDQIRTRTSKEGAKNDGDDDRVVEHTDDRDEVWNEI